MGSRKKKEILTAMGKADLYEEEVETSFIWMSVFGGQVEKDVAHDVYSAFLLRTEEQFKAIILEFIREGKFHEDYKNELIEMYNFRKETEKEYSARRPRSVEMNSEFCAQVKGAVKALLISTILG